MIFHSREKGKTQFLLLLWRHVSQRHKRLPLECSRQGSDCRKWLKLSWYSKIHGLRGFFLCYNRSLPEMVMHLLGIGICISLWAWSVWMRNTPLAEKMIDA